MILRDYECLAHGYFESGETSPKCPYGCANSLVHQVFLKAPGIGTDRTKGIDTTMRSLANDFGLTDVSTRGGDSVKENLKRTQIDPAKQLLDKMGGPWQSLDPNRNALQALSGMGVQGGNMLESVKPLLNQPKPNVVARHDGKIE